MEKHFQFKRIWHVAGCVLVSLFLLSACTKRAPAPYVPIESRLIDTHTVYRGESLYSIAWRYGLDYKVLASLNSIEPPYHIYPGQTLKIKSSGKTKFSASNMFQSAKQTFKPVVKNIQSRPTYKKFAEKTPSFSPSVWVWPSHGEVIRQFSEKDEHKGLDIAGRLGQPIRSAREGKVVFSGSGLAGYGKLVIIKHDAKFMSAYAHNQTLLVKEGDKVARGDIIARMGKTGTDKVHLHFELRKNGKPIDPKKYLKSKS